MIMRICRRLFGTSPPSGGGARYRDGVTGSPTPWTVDQYRQQLLTLAAGWPRVESCRLIEATGRVLGQTVTASRALPPFTNSAMDGFGIAAGPADACPAGYQVVAEIAAGQMPSAGVLSRPIAPGQAVRIMTGAALPPGVDTVVPLEQAEVDGDLVRFVAPVTPGQHVRVAGEELPAGAVILRPGTVLGPRQVAAAAATGAGSVQVARRPRVAVVTTGDELVDPGALAGPVAVFDSNGPYLAAAMAAAGATVVGLWRSRDDEAGLGAVLDQAAAEADVVVAAGGVSAGDHDVSRAVLGPTGWFGPVAMQPGKPQGYGRWAGVPVVALPGNPVSVAVSSAVFVQPLLRAMTGALTPPARSAVVRRGWTSPAGRRQYMPVTIHDNGSGQVEVSPASAGGAGSHLVASLAQADALAVIPEKLTDVQPGLVVDLVDLY